jgi:1,4-dihydroxy-2-naphthoyl-CoA hydrolase
MIKYIKRINKVRATAVNPVMKGGMPRALGIRIISLTRKKVIGEMRIKPMHLNYSGKVNGGAIMAFADVMGAVGAVANRPPGYRGGTIESKTNFFTAGTGPVLSAVSIPLHIGRTTTAWQTTIRNPDGRAVAIVTQTQIMIPDEPELSPGARQKRAARGK